MLDFTSLLSTPQKGLFQRHKSLKNYLRHGKMTLFIFYLHDYPILKSYISHLYASTITYYLTYEDTPVSFLNDKLSQNKALYSTVLY